MNHVTCQRCGQPFESAKHWAKFCSPKCRVYNARGVVLSPMRNKHSLKIDMSTHMQSAVDSLDQMVSRPEIAALFGCSPMTVRRLELDPDVGFPKPVPLSPGLTRWRLSDVREFIKRRAELTQAVEVTSPALMVAEPLL